MCMRCARMQSAGVTRLRRKRESKRAMRGLSRWRDSRTRSVCSEVAVCECARSHVKRRSTSLLTPAAALWTTALLPSRWPVRLVYNMVNIVPDSSVGETHCGRPNTPLPIVYSSLPDELSAPVKVRAAGSLICYARSQDCTARTKLTRERAKVGDISVSSTTVTSETAHRA